MKRIIDLRSDTVTKPSLEMRKAMFNAEVGDDVFGDDPTINKLQEQLAELLGKETALFVPSGTMANQLALAAHTSPGDEIICEEGCHIRNFEGGAAAYLSGVSINAIKGTLGAFTVDQVKPLIRPDNVHFSPSRLICVENSANRAGGTIFPQNDILELKTFADENNLGMHLDGARLWNVAAATGKSEKELAAPFDTVNVCFSKGLGCPVGSAMVGSKELIERAYRFRKRLGGGMRQAGILAAAVQYALENNRKRMTEDHTIARKLAEAISGLKSFTINLDAVQTNIVIFDATPSGTSGPEIADELSNEGVRCVSFGPEVRMVTHRDVNEDDIDYAINILRNKFE